jgi:uncharacterized protein (DUF608 family)
MLPRVFLMVCSHAKQAVVLMSPTLYNQSDYTPAPMVTDYVVPPSSIQLLSELPGIETIQMTGQYPIMQMDVLSNETPVQIHLEAFNPCIPLDRCVYAATLYVCLTCHSQNSSLPIIIFNYTVTNPTSDPIEVSLLGSQQNIAGWDGLTDITNEVFLM